MATTTTPYMGLELPVVGVEPGPTYATDNNTAFTTVDSHDHTTGKGVPITPPGIDINSDLEFNSHNAIDVNALEMVSQSAALSSGFTSTYYSQSGNPTYNNGSGTASRLVNVSYPMVAADLLYASSTTAFGRLAIGTSGQVLKVAGGLPTWSSNTTTFTIRTTTSSGNITSADDVIIANTNTQTQTLPLATGSGKVYYIKTIDSTLGHSTKIDTTGSDTIQYGGTAVSSFFIYTRGEEIQILDYGTNAWQILVHNIPSIWLAYTPTCSWTANSTPTGSWRRIGQNMDIQVKVAVSGGAPTAANLTFTVPSGVTIDTASPSLIGATSNFNIGGATVKSAGNANYIGNARFDSGSATLVNIYFSNATPIWVAVDATNPAIFTTGDFVYGRFSLPISGWNG